MDPERSEIGVVVSILGISLGNVYGLLKDGIGIKVDLSYAKGSISLYLKNGNEIWVKLDNVQITFDGTYEGNYKVLAF